MLREVPSMGFIVSVGSAQKFLVRLFGLLTSLASFKQQLDFFYN